MNEKGLVKQLNEKENYEFSDLTSIMALLRSEAGCPWDREQTHVSIRENFIEETYEVIEAIDNGNRELLCEELGDVLLQVVFHSQIEAESGNTFDINDVINGICKKLIHRHPHIFGDVRVNNTDEVLNNWDSIKNEEKKRETVTSKLRAVPHQLPALMRAEKIGKKAKCYDFASADEAMKKVNEEKFELDSAIEKGDRDNIEEEMGDLLLSLVSLCRKLDIKPENALNRASDKFIYRFERAENEIISSGKRINDMKYDEIHEIWSKNK